MESINENESPRGERDLSGLDAIPTPKAPEVAQAEEEEKTGSESVTVTETAKLKARAIVRGIEKVFKMKVPGFQYTDEKYQEAEQELAPVLEKYNLSNAGPLKYAEEAGAVMFLGGLVVESAGVVKEYRAAQEQENQEPKKAMTIGQPAQDGKASEPFTTQ